MRYSSTVGGDVSSPPGPLKCGFGYGGDSADDRVRVAAALPTRHGLLRVPGEARVPGGPPPEVQVAGGRQAQGHQGRRHQVVSRRGGDWEGGKGAREGARLGEGRGQWLAGVRTGKGLATFGVRGHGAGGALMPLVMNRRIRAGIES
jgi:hypothetical protein